MLSLNIPLQQIQVFFFVFLRVGAILLSMPVLNSKSIPIFFKLCLVFATSLILLPILNLTNLPVVVDLIPLVLGAAGEILIGLIIGLSIKIIFAGIQMAGQLAGYQMGLAIANVMDPATNRQVPLLAQFNNLMALLIFITINAHHLFIRALAESYRLIAPFGFHFSNSLMELLLDSAGNMFIIAIKVGSPIIAALLLSTVAFGLMARTVSQLNIFIVAMPLKIAVGLMFIGFSLPFFTAFLVQLFNGLGGTILNLLRAMG